MANGNKALKVDADRPAVRRVVADVLDLYRDKMTMIEMSAGGRDLGTAEAMAKRKVRTEFTDLDGKRAKVTRIVDTLGQLHARGRIGDGMHKAGVAFQLDFDVARWEAMPIGRYDGMPRSSGTGGVSLQIVEARTATLMALDALGGSMSPCGIAVWWILGARYSINELAGETEKTRDEWKGALIGGLGVLAKHYNFAE